MQVYVPPRLLPPSESGTRFVTVGGAIAADVDGKNHHPTVVHQPRAVDAAAIPSGEVLDLTPDDALFWATAGGMGLTGVIVDATIVLRPIESARCCRHGPARRSRRHARRDELGRRAYHTRPGST